MGNGKREGAHARVWRNGAGGGRGGVGGGEASKMGLAGRAQHVGPEWASRGSPSGGWLLFFSGVHSSSKRGNLLRVFSVVTAEEPDYFYLVRKGIGDPGGQEY